MAKVIFIAFGLICSFVFTNCYVITIPEEDTIYSNDKLYQPNIEDVSNPIEEYKLEETRPKDEFEMIEPVQYVTPAIPEMLPPTVAEDIPDDDFPGVHHEIIEPETVHATFIRDISFDDIPAVHNREENQFAIPVYIFGSQPGRSLFDSDELMSPLLDDNVWSLPPQNNGFESWFGNSGEFMPSMVNGKESLFPRLDESVLEDEYGALLVQIWMLQYCSLHPECDIKSLEAELAQLH